MNENDRYEHVCRSAFERAQEADAQLAEKLDQVIDLLRGDNHHPGVVERIRVLEAAIIPHLERRLQTVENITKRGVWSVLIVGAAFLVQFGAWLWTRVLSP